MLKARRYWAIIRTEGSYGTVTNLVYATSQHRSSSLKRVAEDGDASTEERRPFRVHLHIPRSPPHSSRDNAPRFAVGKESTSTPRCQVDRHVGKHRSALQKERSADARDKALSHRVGEGTDSPYGHVGPSPSSSFFCSRMRRMTPLISLIERHCSLDGGATLGVVI